MGSINKSSCNYDPETPGLPRRYAAPASWQKVEPRDGAGDGPPPGDRRGSGRRRRYAERARQGVDGARRADTERRGAWSPATVMRLDRRAQAV